MNLMFWDSPCPDEYIGRFGAYSEVIWILELSNWMIGCDVSGYSFEHLAFNGIYSGFATSVGLKCCDADRGSTLR